MTDEKTKKPYKLDEDGHIIVAENVPIQIVTEIYEKYDEVKEDKDDSDEDE